MEEIEATRPLWTALTKEGLNGTLTRGSGPGRTSSAEPTLSAKSNATNQANHRERCGGRGAGGFGAPLPSGAGATRQPRSSRGIPPSAWCLFVPSRASRPIAIINSCVAGYYIA